MFEGIFQPMHLLVILMIALIIFRSGKLPDVENAIGVT
jgi:sec-independent protein translocase protein TatA